MATKLKNAVEREIEVVGVTKPVIVSIAPNGVTFRVKGSKKVLVANWTRVIDHAVTPADVPSHLFGKPLELLKHLGRK